MNYIDLFAGAGGLSEGFIKAGFTPVAHVESDKAACYTLKTRLAYHYLCKTRKLKIYNSYLKGDINREQLYSYIPSHLFDAVINTPISADNNKSIFEKIDLLKGDNGIDLIIGGPPCQAYSNIGRAALKHKTSDPRKKLYVEYGKFLTRYKPKVFVFENVPGLKSSDNGMHYKDIKDYFRNVGYIVEDKLLNAFDFGVIQDRKRLIIIGWREDLDFSYPKFKTICNTFRTSDLFIDLPPLKPGESQRTNTYKTNTTPFLSKTKIRCKKDIVLTQHITRPHNDKDLAIYKLAVEQYGKGILIKNNTIPDSLRTQNNTTDFLDRFKVVGDIPHTMIAHIAKDGHHFIYNSENQTRSISVREAARIQSFPDNYYFEGELEYGNRTAAFRQIGNAVPPLMAEKIAKTIKKNLL
ncbi:DNA cytosine methyltransferase [Alistipes indistinctus]|uniref:DNA cytosine methyltransferase n=1 Tax=Alistipes indistinctus TaxID=626932 RepID=UPI00241C68C2|nr:DNA (cytosine-5-)-methyltransferase [Alistipes indistinctus]